MARKPIPYDKNLHPKLARQFCILHKATDKELSKHLEISIGTLYRWKKKYPEFREFIREGKKFTDDEVAIQGLLKRALGYEYEEKEIKSIPRTVTVTDAGGKKITKTEDHVTRKVTVKEVAPDVRAIEFWLQNRDPKKWRQKFIQEVTGADGRPLIPTPESKVRIYIPDNNRDPQLKKNKEKK